MISKALEQRLKKLNNDDFQNRKGNYPRSDIPDSIRYSHQEIVFTFKNTDESTCENFVKRFMKTKEAELKIPKKYKPEIKTYQDGDYQDDWVQAIYYIRESK